MTWIQACGLELEHAPKGCHVVPHVEDQGRAPSQNMVSREERMLLLQQVRHVVHRMPRRVHGHERSPVYMYPVSIAQLMPGILAIVKLLEHRRCMPLEEEEVLNLGSCGAPWEGFDFSSCPLEVYILRQGRVCHVCCGIVARHAARVHKVLQQASLPNPLEEVESAIWRSHGIDRHRPILGLEAPDVAVVIVVHVRHEDALQALDVKLRHAVRQHLHEGFSANVLIAGIDEQPPRPSAHEVAIGAVQRVL
mmetsp:Transcript_88711/g.259281  ORF Transcript_88711/g.259281 Transcript_88711/m.259281 type:complete len:250 (+) Transcript_88711:709-1458(+)